jgi:hypothetical protein
LLCGEFSYLPLSITLHCYNIITTINCQAFSGAISKLIKIEKMEEVVGRIK